MKYKIWMHVESIPESSDEDPRSMDDEILPEPLAIVENLDEAAELMTALKETYY